MTNVRHDVIAGLDPAIHLRRKHWFLRRVMDARVEPAHDDSVCSHVVARHSN